MYKRQTFWDGNSSDFQFDINLGPDPIVGPSTDLDTVLEAITGLGEENTTDSGILLQAIEALPTATSQLLERNAGLLQAIANFSSAAAISDTELATAVAALRTEVNKIQRGASEVNGGDPVTKSLLDGNGNATETIVERVQ